MPRLLPSILALGIPLGCTSVLGIDGNYVLGTEEAGFTAVGGAATGGNGETGGTDTGGSDTSGGSSSGGLAGMTGSGGIMDTGGTNATGGAGGTASCDTDGASCPSGQKCCPASQPSGPTASFCAEPAPIVGCDRTDCMPCPAPPDNGIAVCTAGQCDVQCNPNFTRKGNACQADGAGGAGGGGASGTGGAPTCVRSQCPGCGLAGPFGCCRSNGTCGCIPYFGPCL